MEHGHAIRWRLAQPECLEPAPTLHSAGCGVRLWCFLGSASNVIYRREDMDDLVAVVVEVRGIEPGKAVDSHAADSLIDAELLPLQRTNQQAGRDIEIAIFCLLVCFQPEAHLDARIVSSRGQSQELIREPQSFLFALSGTAAFRSRRHPGLDPFGPLSSQFVAFF
jgi:hypothetical protein